MEILVTNDQGTFFKGYAVAVDFRPEIDSISEVWLGYVRGHPFQTESEEDFVVENFDTDELAKKAAFAMAEKLKSHLGLNIKDDSAWKPFCPIY